MQHASRFILTGLPEATCHIFLGAELNHALNARWVAPETLRGQQSNELLAEEHAETHWLWLYQSPWQWRLTQPADTPWDAWLAHHQQALHLRRVLGERLQLINVSNTSATALATELGVPEASTDHPTPEMSTHLRALATLCASAAPTSAALQQAWTLYETLEAAAWLPEGQAPEFRASLDVDEPQLATLFAALQAGQQAPLLEYSLATAQATLEATEEKLEASQQREQSQQTKYHALHEKHSALAVQKTAAEQSQHALAQQLTEANEENDLLLAQLHQVQEELEKHYLAGQQHQTQLDESRQQLAAEKQHVVKIQQAQKTAKTALASEQKSTSELKQQIDTLTRDHEKALASLQAQLNAQQASAEGTHSQQQELQEENDLLLAQLHQVQEELERYFIANQQYQDASHDAQHTFLRARQHISRLAMSGTH